MIRSIHPFPARMAPDLAIAEISQLKVPSVVLDPMAGSGTVVRQASELGHRARGFDLDPLAVLMATVWTTPTDPTALERLCRRALDEMKTTAAANIRLSWIDDDEETRRFAEYWFADQQRSDLRRISYVLARLDGLRLSSSLRSAANVLRLALSRIIITKEHGASLARDVSHSRPHKVAENSSFDVMFAFERSVGQVRQLLSTAPPAGDAEIKIGDARWFDRQRIRGCRLDVAAVPQCYRLHARAQALADLAGLPVGGAPAHPNE